jgi:hypothetical protein
MSSRPAAPPLVFDSEQNPPRILLISGDRRFRAVAAALFIRRGWPVTVGRFEDDVGAMVAQDRPDVAVVDASHSLTLAGRAVATLKRDHRSITVVVVSEAHRPGLPALPTYPKWGSFDSLCLVVDQAHRRAAGLSGTAKGNGRRSLSANRKRVHA